MNHRVAAASLVSVSRSAHRMVLLAGVSAVALTSAAPQTAYARPLTGGTSVVSAPNIASDAAAQAAQQAAGAARQTKDSLTRAARAVQDMQAVQAAARAAAAARQTSATAPVNVPNGLAIGGLDPNLAAGWSGANGPTQGVDASGQTQVGIRQTSAQAILNWTTFNVGARTTLTFDQQGNANWVALNRVTAATAPSQILGNIKADGQVYVINQSGIIFGGNSQINVGALIASTANISDSEFSTNGIYSTQANNSYKPSFTAAGGKVVVEAGALISTSAPASVTSGGGYVLLIGSEVSNAGSISTPKGQTMLAAGDSFILRKGYGTDANQFSTTNGNEIATVIAAGSAAGRVTNTGIVLSQQGDITLAGRVVMQDGVLLSTTSVNQRGTIHLLNAASDAGGSVTMTGKSLSWILPELDSNDTALNAQRDALIAASGLNPLAAQFNNLSPLTDRRDQSRVEIVTGGLVNFQNGSLTVAQGGQVAVSAGTRVFAEAGSMIDVSGVQGAVRPMSANQVQVNVQGSELRDAPLNRDNAALLNKNVWIDVRDLVLVPAGTGGYGSDRYYTKGGLLEVGGYLANTAHTIGEWTAVGGTITLSAPQVVAQQGATFDISGGSVSYQAGWILSTVLIGSDGRRYTFDNAPADMKFVAAGGGFVRTHNIQGQVVDSLTEVWTSVLSRGTIAHYEAGYTVGRDAGRLNLSTPTAIFEADIIADVVVGERQGSARAAGVTDGYKQVQNAAPLQGTLGLGRYDATANQVAAYGSDVRFGDVADISAGLSATNLLPSVRTNTAWFDADRINDAQLGGLDIGTSGSITIDRAITLADGGKINLNAAVVDIKADVTARGGSIVVDNVLAGAAAGGRGAYAVLLKDGLSSITLYDGATLDLRGLWVNAAQDDADEPQQAFINGGSVTLRSTHDVTLREGSVIDVSSGAAILTTGKTKGSRGGDVTLIADQQNSTVTADGLLTLDGTIRAYGVSGGGTLKIESGTAIAIGGKVLATDGVLGAGETAPADLVLLEDYQVKAGEVLPASYSYQATVFMPGDTLTADARIQYVTLAADWTPPAPNLTFYSYTIKTGADQKGPSYNIYSANAVTLRAGTIVSISANNMRYLAGYTLTAAFGDGLPSAAPFTKTAAAGTPAPADGTIAAGTLIAAGSVLQRAAAVKEILQVDASLFQSGFSSYDINGRQGVAVAAGAQLDVAMPVYRLTDVAFSIATGENPSLALSVWTPPEWIEDARNSSLTQRGGASLILRSNVGEGTLTTASGPITIQTGASIRVDAGQSISLQGTNFTIDGTLTAPGGTISLTQASPSLNQGTGDNKPGLIWIGEHAVLDVAARAVTATNARGETYGVVGNGGSILIGGAVDWETTGESSTLNAFVVIRPGALLDASGASAVLDIAGSGLAKTSTPLEVASNGGSIVIKSSNGIYLDGTLRAAAGGANAAGGTLALALEAPNYLRSSTSGDVLRHREFVIADIQGDSAIADADTMAEAKAGLVTGTARLGVDRIEAGGFGTLSLLSDGLISFDGSVTLAMSQSLSLYAGAFALGANAAADSRVSLAGPYLRLAGVTRIAKDLYTLPAVRWDEGYGTPSQQSSSAVFSVAADLLDIRDRVVFGIHQSINTQAETYTLDRRGFALVDLLSRGDVRMLGGTGTKGAQLQTPGNITVTAAQIYPATKTTGSITAGYIAGSDALLLAGSVLTILRYGDTDPDVPYSAFGLLTLAADTINQGGVVRAPFGRIVLGGVSSGGDPRSDAIHLLAGSITSVSGAGLVMPYGGTADGTSYTYNGAPVAATSPTITLNGLHIDADAGSLIDLSGGGELTGAGFVSGRGGSVNILTTPLVNANPGYSYSAKGNQVYAIVPSSSVAYAPVVQEAGFGLPAVGSQITIPEGVPGLAAGTYTLMPATYALLSGAYRVELGSTVSPAVTGVATTGSGSYIVSAYLSVANTAIRSSLPNRVIITAADQVRSHSSFNETTYNAYVLANAATNSVARGWMTVDAGGLNMVLAKAGVGDDRMQLLFDGALRIRAEAGSDGYSGAVSITGINEILATGQGATAGMVAASVSADEISKLDAPRLILNGGYFGDIVLRSGARLSAAEIVFNSRGRSWRQERGAITIEEGATISTIGRGSTGADTSAPYLVDAGTLIVSNGVITLLRDGTDAADVDITIGACVTANCNLTTTIASEGTIGVMTSGAVSFADNVSYGTRNLVLGLSAINLGSDASIATAAAAGRLPTGLTLNQAVLARLLAGNTAIGAPALETLALSARDAVNVFGDVTLDASTLDRLVLATPAIYGYGAAGDTATIRAGEFVWTGSSLAPGAAMADRLGDSALNIVANRVVFGYGLNTQPSTTTVDNRIALGFANVNITATEYVTSTNKSTLGVYARQGAYDAVSGYQYSGGNLTITAPLVTGAASSVNTITAGGDIRIVGSGGAAGSVDALGATLKLTGANVFVDSSVVLPSGRLELTAAGDIVLGDNSRLDLSGRAVKFFDVTKYSWGGDLVMTSRAGDIRQAAGSVIDLSAQYNSGGTATVTALGASAGHVALAGSFRGGATGIYDAGGTYVPYDAAELGVYAQTLADFAGLNARLNAGELFGARRFQIKQGSLVIGDEVKAREVEITLDGGSLTVNGTIDASGFQVGTIRLAAMDDLTINGMLDAHGTGMRFDSYGAIIESPNRAIVDLTTRYGTLTIGGNAEIDLRAGTNEAFGAGAHLNDGVARGTLTLNAPRLGGTGVAAGTRGVDGANDVAVNVQGTPLIRGAKTIAVNAFRIYDDAPLAAAPDVTGYKPQEITQDYLKDLDIDSVAFINAALANTSLSARLAGLGSYHLRPGVDIVSKVSADNPNGDLTVAGDLDLSGYRYGPNTDRNVNSATYGFGEPGAFNIRAVGNLNIHGSINDGFAPPPSTPDDVKGWLLEQGVAPYGGDLVLATAVTLETGTEFKAGVTLNYDLPAYFGTERTGPTSLPSGAVLPVRATLASSLALSAGTVVQATIYKADGSVAYAAGTVLPNAVTLTAGMQLGAGTVLKSAASFAALVWPKGVPLPVDMTSTAQMTLAAGSLIPAQTNVKLVGGQAVDLRGTTGGIQGRNWALASMLAAGASSSDVTLVAGADLGSANVRARNALRKGDIILADTHYVSRYASGGDVLNLSQSGAEALCAAVVCDDYGYTVNDMIGKSEAEVLALLYVTTWEELAYSGLPGDFWDPSLGNIELGLTQKGLDALMVLFGGYLPDGITDPSALLHKTRLEVAALYGVPGYSWDDMIGQYPSNFADPAQNNLGPISLPATTTVVAPSFSVVRTGTGDLSLLAAGSIKMQSLYGVYTAGTATTVDASYTLARTVTTDGTVLGSGNTDYEAALASYQAWYPDHGGNVLIAAGGDLVGDIYGQSYRASPSSVLTGNWLWRQGSGTAAVDETIATSWWINFGTYVPKQTNSTKYDIPDLVGFTGIGALGGGNITIRVDGNAGAITQRSTAGGVTSGVDRSQGLVVAVGSTGRVGADGSLTLTGGGDIDMQIAGALNPNLAITDNVASQKQALGGSLINLRGTLAVTAASIGGIDLIYGLRDSYDTRGADPYAATWSEATSGITVVPGDATVYLQTLGDLVLGGAGDAGRSVTPSSSAFSVGGIDYASGGGSWFTLWTDHTAINLVSAGGNLTPTTSTGTEVEHYSGSANQNSDQNSTDGWFTYPSILRAAALGGSIYYGRDALPFVYSGVTVTLAPSATGSLEMLAYDSIYAGHYAFSLSGTGTALPTPFNPAFAGYPTGGAIKVIVTNASPNGIRDQSSGNPINGSLFVFGPNDAKIGLDRADDADPVRFYAREGDIVGLVTGETVTFLSGTTWLNASAPVVVRAGRDIVAAGLAPGVTAEFGTAINGYSHGNLIVHSDADDVSILAAGRDILYANIDIAGPGALEISAGRNLYQAAKGVITSLGAIAAGDTRPGASIAMLAGVGEAGPDYANLAALYLDPSRLAVEGVALAEQPGKVAKTYEKELAAWLKDRYGFTGTDADALAYFGTLAPERQLIFLRQVYFAELTAGGREYNDSTSSRYGSYLRGRNAIAALFPDQDANGQAVVRAGDITMYGASGVRTQKGGDIQTLTPGGRTIIGIEGQVPPASAGLVTQGQGNIQLYSKGSILLGLSRIMTTFGGNIIGWSAEGDINAGRGSKTTVVYTPPRRVYDSYGNVSLSPQVPSSGAGIATLNPIPEVKAGDVDLIAPLGTIDAGEAGIRVSGNANLAALQIMNAANIQVQGKSTGIPTVQAPNISASLAASNATAATQQTAVPAQGGNDRPSVIIVEVLGYGGGDGQQQTPDERPSRKREDTRNYDPANSVRILGNGPVSAQESRMLTEQERKELGEGADARRM
ncbi:filamentous hemagglutinin family protein [Rhodopseudomonas rhenobacensis]|uniref:Filamentous hemagglutinin family protein n=1 Tax=Rhodopseudomonas rhenobacensis TaxID=87461 RepID=A0A7W7Z0X8_9BRAD|nr:filamentous haemagglutinin family protein [Rhodopseudomonas rhenobacensis]MBB5045898.1 filamentous hemagglutinin family protein [Rhodopseudomonas rhenobacensis]